MLDDQLEKLYIKYDKELYLYAFSLCKDHHMAQDLASDTFFKAILSFDDNISYIKYWLFRVCKNLFLDHIRKDKEFSDIDKLDYMLVLEETPLDKLIDAEEKRRLYGQVMALPSSYREVIILYYYCNFTLKEIIKTTGLTESNAKVLLFRARKKLKLKLEGEK
ncbi:RNA polymerase sigma factor [Tissierella sp. Yu-01]|uniref:RNA polymerase sigma factor n=1 Tax=Tissierella sp. Yu-01 TaxID=3035694 RepID=UPI00240E2BE8|nr:RNA polymerase sigma factor [Tissierella sp. Yu-01]WFA09034.1 RNA polymerase sigma factor [Tissierella sp. Yu-01]